MKKSQKKILIGTGVGIGALAVISAAVAVPLVATKKAAIPFNLKITSGSSRINLNFNGTDRSTYALAKVTVEIYEEGKTSNPIKVDALLRSKAFSSGINFAGLNLKSNTKYNYRVLTTGNTLITLFEGQFTTGQFKKTDRQVQLIEADIESKDVGMNSIGITVFYGSSLKSSNGELRVTYISADDQQKQTDNSESTTITTDGDSAPSQSTLPSPTGDQNGQQSDSQTSQNNQAENASSNNVVAPAQPKEIVKTFKQDSNVDSQIIKLEGLDRGKTYHVKVDYFSSALNKEIELFDDYVKTQNPNFDFLFNSATEDKEQQYYLNINDANGLIQDTNVKLTFLHKKQDATSWSKVEVNNQDASQFDIQKEIISGNTTDPILFYDFKLEMEKADGTKEDLIPLTQTVLLNPAHFDKFNINVDDPKLVNLNDVVLRNMDHDQPTRHNTFAVIFNHLNTEKKLDAFNNFLRTTKTFSTAILDNMLRYMGYAVTNYINGIYNKNTWDLNVNNKNADSTKGYWNSKKIWFQHPTHSNYPLPYILVATNETEGFLTNLDDRSKYTLGALKEPASSVINFRGEAINFSDFWTPNTTSVSKSGWLLGISQTVWSNQSANSMIHDRLTPDKLIKVFKFMFGSKVFPENHDFTIPEPTMTDDNSNEITSRNEREEASTNTSGNTTEGEQSNPVSNSALPSGVSES